MKNSFRTTEGFYLIKTPAIFKNELLATVSCEMRGNFAVASTLILSLTDSSKRLVNENAEAKVLDLYLHFNLFSVRKLKFW